MLATLLHLRLAPNFCHHAATLLLIAAQVTSIQKTKTVLVILNITVVKAMTGQMISMVSAPLVTLKQHAAWAMTGVIILFALLVDRRLHAVSKIIISRTPGVFVIRTQLAAWGGIIMTHILQTLTTVLVQKKQLAVLVINGDLTRTANATVPMIVAQMILSLPTHNIVTAFLQISAVLEIPI